MEAKGPTCQAGSVFERFTDSARQVLVLAQEEARLLGHSFIGTEHILLGLLHQDGAAAEVLTELGASLSTVRERVQETIGLTGTLSGSPPFTPRAKKVLELSLREALQLGHHNIGTELILIGLIREGEGVACQVLVSQGIDLASVRQQVMQRLVVVESARTTDDLRLRPSPTDDDVSRGRVVTCSFCGLSPPESGQLVSGNNAFICENCVHQWSIRLGRRSATVRNTLPVGPSSEVVTPGEQPTDPHDARAEIKVVFSTGYSALSEDGQSAMRVEKGADLGWAVAAARANRTAYLDREIIFTVDEIVFVDPEHAAVWFSIFVNGGQVLNGHRGDAVLVDGEWKMALSTFTQMMAMAGVSLP
jgi:hypothetical protein